MKTVHRHPGSRWLLVLGLAALMIVGIAVLGSGLSGATASAERLDQADATPTVEAAPTADPFPSTGTMTDTVIAALKAYDEALAQQEAGRDPGLRVPPVFGPVEVASHWTEIHLPLVGSSRSGTPPPTPTTRPQGPPADVANTIWPAPSIRVIPGSTLEYEIRAKNYGEGSARVDRVTLPYSKSQLTVETARFEKQGDWVSEVTDDHVTVNFNDVARGELRKATIVFRVNRGLANDAVISMRATTSWSDERTGGSWRSNWAPVLVGQTNNSAQWAWLTVEPLGGNPGTTHRFFSDRFIPGEGVVTWLNTPNGVRALDLRGIADTFGRVTLDFRSTGLTRGTYSMVLYGARSNLTAIATFYVW